MRRAKMELPVMVITARDALADRVAGLDSGADDYPSSLSTSTSCSRGSAR